MALVNGLLDKTVIPGRALYPQQRPPASVFPASNPPLSASWVSVLPPSTEHTFSEKATTE